LDDKVIDIGTYHGVLKHYTTLLLTVKQLHWCGVCQK